MWQHVAGGEGAREFLPLDELEGAEVCVAAAPLESALVTTIATLRARRPVAVLRRRDVETLRPLVDYRTRAWPSCLTRAASERDFAADVAAGVRQGRLHAEAWAPVLDAPERWLSGYTTAIERVCAEVEPRWRRASHLLQREAERVAAAAERGGAVALAATAGSVQDGAWRLFERPRPAGLRLRRGRLMLRPLLAPVSLVEAADELLSVSYPVAARADDSPPASLDALLAPARATILRELDRPVNAGQLAERHGFSPSGITHHLGALEKAGLIARERAGRRVVVQRTHRGTRLLALYE
jgi:DNA-binding transcriptional ArsR family regulator